VSAGVTYPKGFTAGAVAAGLKPSGRLDVALLLGDPGTTAAGLFTTNEVVAAPVTLSRAHLAAGGGRGVLVNSGQANAATGARGDRDAIAAVAAGADALGVYPVELLQCSTGVIGEPLHMDRLLGALPLLVAGLGADRGADFAEAIMTTDTVSKQATADAGPHRVGGAAKGVGMIAPSLATMLAFVTTDATIGPLDLHAIARGHLSPHLESISVDGCTSTNDSVLLFASGAAGGPSVTPSSQEWNRLADAIDQVGASLASQLIHDGEGVTHVMLVDLTGAADDRAARALAATVADSPLVKTALFGGDPNPGRILQALGTAGEGLRPDDIDVWVGPTQLVHGGTIPPAYFEANTLHAAAVAAMASPEVSIRIAVGDGPGTSRVLGCDLSYDYVRINGEYTT
jgi:glutamate N-acetyltransferase/amino-acid N-acetyltransferase